MQGVSLGLEVNARVASKARSPVLWHAARFATTGYWVSQLPGRITAPADPGGARMHLIVARVLWQATSAGSKRAIIVRKNLTKVLGMESHRSLPAAGQTCELMELEIQARLAPTDYVELIPYHDAGYEIYILANSGRERSEFTVLSYR